MAQTKPRITLGSPPDPRNRALIDGLVKIDGYEIEHIGKYSPGEFHYRFVQGVYDVAEISAATFLRAKEKDRRFVERPGDERSLGKSLLEHLAARTPRTKCGKSAKNKLKLLAW